MLRRHLFNAHSDLSIEQVNTIFEKAVTKSNEENEKLSPEEDIGKKHALKKYDQFPLNTSCFLGSTGSDINPVVQFHEICVTKIMNKLICYYFQAKFS